ncbi:hypothetical protein [Cerasicoccus fimbriatus]|uniref:hypothetical protein n=1 Tax=Cerasicoccus fimbriatus TaxID=3014554 RepID=UPI0022B37FCA|nr:hypothetical protein [Cerasicoccus sp. TK19100]
MTIPRHFIPLGTLSLISLLPLYAENASQLKGVNPYESTTQTDATFTASFDAQNVSEPSQKITRNLTLKNNSSQPIECEVNFSIQVDSNFYEGRPAASGTMPEYPDVGRYLDEVDQTLTLKPGESKTLPLTSNIMLSPGYYFLNAMISGGGHFEQLYDNQYVLPKAPEKLSAESRFGINVSDPKLIGLNQRLGFGYVRFENLKWAFVNPRKGYFAYDGSVGPWYVKQDEIAQAYTDAGFQFTSYFFLTPHWATSAPEGVTKKRQLSYPPKDYADYAEGVFQTIARFGGKEHPASELMTSDKVSGKDQLRLMELWNEVNLDNPNWGFWVGTMGEYFEMFRPAAEAGKRADPNVKISHSSYAGIALELVDQLRTYTYEDGKHPLDFTDIINVHFYSGKALPETATLDPNADRTGEAMAGASTYEENLRDLNAWRNQFKPDAEIWITETGYDVGGKIGSTLRMQAAKIPRCIMMALAEGIDRVFYYREAGSTPSQHAGAGLVTTDHELRPSWLTMATMIRQLDGAGVNEGIRLPYPDDNVRLYLWNTNHGLVVSAWAVEGDARVDLDLGTVTLTDAFGYATEKELNGGWAVGEFPVYLSNIKQAPALMALKDKALLAKQQHAQLIAESQKRQAYLFDFGSAAYPGLLRGEGLIRPFTAVTKDTQFQSTTGYGFTQAATRDQDQEKLRKLPLLRDKTFFSPRTEFKLTVKPGKYRVKGFAEGKRGAVDLLLADGNAAPSKNNVQPSSDSAEANFTTVFDCKSGEITVRFSAETALSWIAFIEWNAESDNNG